jgi:hypothetical protein
MLFGICKNKKVEDYYINDKNLIPLKTGIPSYKIMKYGPLHTLNAD